MICLLFAHNDNDPRARDAAPPAACVSRARPRQQHKSTPPLAAAEGSAPFPDEEKTGRAVPIALFARRSETTGPMDPIPSYSIDRIALAEQRVGEALERLKVLTGLGYSKWTCEQLGRGWCAMALVSAAPSARDTPTLFGRAAFGEGETEEEALDKLLVNLCALELDARPKVCAGSGAFGEIASARPAAPARPVHGARDRRGQGRRPSDLAASSGVAGACWWMLGLAAVSLYAAQVFGWTP